MFSPSPKHKVWWGVVGDPTRDEAICRPLVLCAGLVTPGVERTRELVQMMVGKGRAGWNAGWTSEWVANPGAG